MNQPNGDRIMETINVSNYTIKEIILSNWIENPSQDKTESLPVKPSRSKIDIFRPIRSWIEGIAIDTPALAHRICKLIPAQCPFARKINLFGRTLLTIPPLCKINPVYEELMTLRFRALTYLADECGEDISTYC